MKLEIKTFDMGTLDEKARKVCEESTEFYAAHYFDMENGTIGVTTGLLCEIGDVVTAMANYCNAAGIDMQACIDLVEAKNRMRGRYGNMAKGETPKANG